MDKKQWPLLVVGLVVIAAVTFYAGMKIGQGKDGNIRGNNFMGQNRDGQMMPDDSRQQGNRQMMGQGFIGGQIISLDDKSVTLKMRDGGSKIIFYSDSTEILKTATGTIADLTKDQNITVTGKTNTDGSVTAETIQLRPDMPAPIDTRSQPIK